MLRLALTRLEQACVQLLAAEERLEQQQDLVSSMSELDGDLPLAQARLEMYQDYAWLLYRSADAELRRIAAVKTACAPLQIINSRDKPARGGAVDAGRRAGAREVAAISRRGQAAGRSRC